MKRISTGFLLAVGTTASAQAAQPPYANLTFTLPATGNGSAYASRCASEHWLYTLASSDQSSRNKFTTTESYTYDGSSVRVFTFYKDATTLCDGKPRVSSSPAIPLSTWTTTVRTGAPTTKLYTETQFSGRLIPSPSCSIKPADCDPLWAEFSSSLEASASQITRSPPTPPCRNSSAASSDAAFQSSRYGCGKCTIFGEGVQLLYFPVPTTVSRDMCATTPSASLTHYGPGAVITAYAGTGYSSKDKSVAGQRTAVVNGHTFTSGTAYISLASVWASDRCSSTHGSVITDAILAMPSESVLSLRYTQDHFEYFFDHTASQTGYPVSYADFNEPVPYSAWNGQSTCRAADDGYSCQTIYAGMYRPQLAIPPGIRDLSPDFEGCVFWYKGLYDPPLALTEVASEATPTLPGEQDSKSTAMPSVTAVATLSVPMSESQQWRPGSGPQSLIAKPTATLQNLPHTSHHHQEGSGSVTSAAGVDDNTNGNKGSQGGLGSEGNGSHDSAEQSPASGDQPSHQEGNSDDTQNIGSSHTDSHQNPAASDVPHHAPDGDGSNDHTGTLVGSGEPINSFDGDTHTRPNHHQGAGSQSDDGMGSAGYNNEATADSQASNRNDIGGYIHSGLAGWQGGSDNGPVHATTAGNGARPESPTSGSNAGTDTGGQHIGNDQDSIPITTRTGSETTNPAEQHSTLEAAALLSVEEQSGTSASTATGARSGINGKASSDPLNSELASTMAEPQRTGQTAVADTNSASASTSTSRNASIVHVLLFVVFLAVLMTSKSG